ncbi:fimbrial protein [Oleiphilus sp. HI0071]|nr:fimbrial protein [Oleiphilus sp. HI0065]KZY87855.1 fimbrial protein [Oleiphilus sp. HI0071]KZY89292.1 fimbrial protein [Oleiphilus sp. HI0073]KZZ17250.1 fimbrial protein [Oleiphilus sp. HI0079]KZZ18535.1 fimbrial protein [Oleiphilus sp. HI0080]KZZ51312.1 fimbrial protein [Oleiphilus sp. HI0122]KZZ52655.1 fimbrial protein [Oleiphilus sp. HI0118]KZZ81413.1 fimbrial protein [Oleiphilus sp. HI0133]
MLGQPKLALSMFMAMFMSVANAAVLQGVKFASMPGDTVEIVLSFDSPPAKPKVFSIGQTADISVTVDGATNGIGKRYHELGLGNARRMTVIEAENSDGQMATRFVIDLATMAPYTSEVSGNDLIMRVGAAAPAPSASQESSEQVTASSAASDITSIDFRRGEKGDGQVIIGLNNPSVDIDMSEVGGNIQLVISGAELPEALRQRLDVVDFATPVHRIESYVEDGKAKIVIKPEGNYDYLAYQADNQFVVSVEKVTEQEAEERLKEKFPYTGEKLSLNFQNIEVRAVLQLIADFTGLNLVASDTVGGSITLRLQNVPWDQALELVLKTKGLDKRTTGNVMLVAPAEEIAAREKLEIETNKQVAELAPVRLEIIQVNYAKAADIVAMLQQDQELISGRGYISSDERTNTISVRETSDKLQQIRTLVDTWDIPVRQVLIEARIVRARSNITEEMGIQWGGSGATDTNGGGHNWGFSGSTEGNVEYFNSGTVTYPGALAVDLGVTRANASSFGIGFTTDNMLLDLELSAFEADGKGEIVAQPKIVTADRQTATIKSGEEIPYQEASSSGATSVSFKEAVLSLEVTPQITPDDNVIMDLKVNQDDRGEVTAGIPSIDTNEVITQVLVGNGETIVLGGIFQSEQATTVTKTPFLGDIPYIGNLFKKTENIDQRSELLIFITPKLIKDGLIDQ